VGAAAGILKTETRKAVIRDADFMISNAEDLYNFGEAHLKDPRSKSAHARSKIFPFAFKRH
jgi:hypothetical protein